MKKFTCFFLCFMLVMFVYPSICVNAEGASYQVKTASSVSSIFGDNGNYNLVQSSFCNYNGNNVAKIYSALSSLQPQYDSYALYLSGNTLLYFNYDSSIRLLFSCLNTVENGSFNPSGYLQWPNRSSIYNNYTDCCYYSCDISGDTFTWTTASSISEYFGIVESDSWGYYWQSFQGSLLDSSEDFYVYCVEDSSQFGGSSRGTIWRAIDNNENTSFTNFNGFNAPYVNDQGSIVDPSGPQNESNENHMYFKDCDLGFCIPKNMTNFNSFGGAYVYCRYVVDDWVVNHISDYKVVVSMNSIVGGRQFGSSVTLPLDRDGCVTIPFNAFSTNEIVGFTTYINKTLIEQDFYKTFLYSLSNQQLQVMYQQKTFAQGWKDFVTGGSSNPLLAVVSPSNTEFISGLSDIATAVTQRFDPYKIRLQCYLIDSSENQSGSVARMFDLVTGNDDAVDNSGLTNDNPFEPDVDDPEYVPTVPGDNTTYPQIIINNGGSWTGNLDGALRYDPGYRELKEDIDADPDGNFTQYLAPFENNDAGGFIMGFINGMPSAMKTIFISGFGVLTLLGIYRFIRRG